MGETLNRRSGADYAGKSKGERISFEEKRAALIQALGFQRRPGRGGGRENRDTRDFWERDQESDVEVNQREKQQTTGKIEKDVGMTD